MQDGTNGGRPERRSARRRTTGNPFELPRRSFQTRAEGPARIGAGTVATTRPQRTESQRLANCLWVKQIGKRIVGLVRLVEAGPATARIVTFRIDPEWYRTAVVTDLIQAVVDHCRQKGCVRVLVDFSVAPPWMPSVLSRQGFRVAWHRRTWEAVLDGPSRLPRPEFSSPAQREWQ